MPLRGIRVIEWGVFMQGPLASDMLGAFGADVIKIEDPLRGDPGRGTTRQHGVPQALPDGRTAIFESHNRNKRGIAIDLKTDPGLKLVYRLIEKSDVFVQNQRKGVAEKLGLGYETLREINPVIIYAQGSGLGVKGPDSDLPITDAIAQARAGLLRPGAASNDSTDPPEEPVMALADDIGAVNLAFGVVMALVARERLGIGQKVESSILAGALRTIRHRVAGYYLTGVLMPRARRETAPNPLYNQYKCQDGRWVRLAITQTERYWPGFCRALGRADLEMNPLYCDPMTREQHCAELVTVLDAAFASKPYEEWRGRFREEDLLFGLMQSIPDLANDPQVTENRYLVDFVDSAMGTIKVPGMPFDLTETPWSVKTQAPELGQHTEEVLIDILGCSWEEIAELKSESVIP